jgi:hypothetical protein
MAIRGLSTLSDKRMRELLRRLDSSIHSSPARKKKLGHLVRAANWMLERKEDSIRFDHLDKEKESAHFDDVREEILIERALRRLPDELPATVLCHELQHAYDEMAGRPYTFEAEVRAFKAEAEYLSWTKPEKVSARIKDANGWHWFGYIYRKRLDFLEGDLDLEHSTVFDFVKSYLGESKFDGLQTVDKTQLDVEKAMEIKRHERADLERQKSRRPLPARERESLDLRIEILDADLSAGRRVAESLRLESGRVARGNPLFID